MAHNHVQPYVRHGVAGWKVVWRIPREGCPMGSKTDHVSTQRFPIADGVSAAEAWEEAFKFAARIYSEGVVSVPAMPDVNWKALGATNTETFTQRYKTKTEHAESLYRRGFDPHRIATEAGVAVRSIYRWRKKWK